MEPLDTGLLAEALGRLLAASDPAPLARDPDGWVAVETLCVAASASTNTTVDAAQVMLAARLRRGFEVGERGLRLARPPRLPSVPDILFHATTAAGEDEARARGVLQGDVRRRLWLSEDEAHAWRVAHRLGGDPRLVVVDAARARRSGVRFQRARQPGVFTASPIPGRHLMNLREGYGEQWSAGGLPVRRFPDGLVRVALVEVTRRSGVTWEIAKGKLEQGESPEDAGVREVQEEMGLSCDLHVLRHVGDVRYGFVAPGGLPRLKTIFLYLMAPADQECVFAPRAAEGIGQVRWFTPEDAAVAVTHTSLQPLMWRARDLLARYGTSPASDPLP